MTQVKHYRALSLQTIVGGKLRSLFFSLFLLSLTGFFLPILADTQAPKDLPLLSILGKLSIDGNNISGMVKTDDFLALATDEGTQIQILPKAKRGYRATASGLIELNLSQRPIKEFDLEAMAWHRPYLYVIGSHSKKRKKLKEGLNKQDNIKRISAVIEEPDRNVLFRIRLNRENQPTQIDKISLTETLQNQPILAPFLAIPSKENGVDIEGLAVREKHGKTQLFVGFRGPVFRENLAPILRLTLKKKRFEIKKSKLLFVNLQGLGVRDLYASDQGFLILAGPINKTPNRFVIHQWTGNTDFNPLPTKLVLPVDSAGNPEAIAEQNLPGWGKGVWIAKDGSLNGDIHFYPFARNSP